MYEFFAKSRTVIVNDAADFTGMNGCYLYQGRDEAQQKERLERPNAGAGSP